MGYFYNDSNGIIVNGLGALNIETFLVGVCSRWCWIFGKRMGFSSLKGRL
jgi:hypothetical protein